MIQGTIRVLLRSVLGYARRLRNRYGDVRSTWKRGLSGEVAFWRSILDDKEGVYSEDIRRRLDPNRPLSDEITSILNVPPGTTVKILDLGAGPLTYLGKVWVGRTVEITATDALADEYDKQLKVLGIVPPVRTTKGNAEDIDTAFLANTFDLIYSRNALDHVYDPVKALEGAMTILKPGGWLVLDHYVNEAEHSNYGGLHEWNLAVENGQFVIWNRNQRTVINEVLTAVRMIEMTVNEVAELGERPGTQLSVRIQKS